MPVFRAAWKPLNYTDDFYFRIHINPKSIDVGNSLPPLVVPVEVWNAYLSMVTLAAISAPEGVAVTPTAPLAFQPTQARTFDVAILADGPPAIAGSVTFEWTGIPDVSIPLSGARVSPWFWPADWSEPVLERLEWRTDVLQPYRGEEQRRSLRALGPRQSLEFSVTVTADERRRFEAQLWGWGGRVFALPLVQDGVTLSTAVSAGALTITVDPALRQFQADTLALLVNEKTRAAEAVEIDTVGPTSLALKRATLGAWPAGTLLYPARPARLEDAAVGRFDGDTASAPRLRFEMEEPASWPASAGATTYRGYPVLEAQPNWAAEPTLAYQRKAAVFDPGTGPRFVIDEAQMPLTAQSLFWTLHGRAAVDLYRRRLFALRGRLGAIWVASGARDLVPSAAIAAAATVLTVRACGYTAFHRLDPNRRDVRIETTTGQVFYRRITGASEVDAQTESLVIDSALGVALEPAQFALVSFLALSRQEADAAELAWWTGDCVDAAQTFRTFRHDI